jgi:hypothetical protein
LHDGGVGDGGYNAILAETSIVEPDIIYIAKHRMSIVSARGTVDGVRAAGSSRRA